MIDAYSPEEVVEMIMLKKRTRKMFVSYYFWYDKYLSDHLIIIYKLSLDMDDEDMSTKIEALPLSSQHSRDRLVYILVKIQ